MVSTVRQSLATDAPSLLALTKKEGSSHEKVFGLLQVHLMLVNRNSKVKNGLSKMEVDMLAGDIIKDFPFLTFADIAVIMRRFYHGEYGQLYGSLSSGDIYQWFAQYADERLDAAYEMNREKDRQQYADIHPDDSVLEALGYKKDENGNYHIDPREHISRQSESRVNTPAEDSPKDAEFRAWKAKYVATGKID